MTYKKFIISSIIRWLITSFLIICMWLDNSWALYGLVTLVVVANEIEDTAYFYRKVR